MDPAIEFQRLCAQHRDDDTLCLPTWSVDDWQGLFVHGTTLQVPSGSMVIQRGEGERALYFVLSGALVARESLGVLYHEHPGSVFGEIALFEQARAQAELGVAAHLLAHQVGTVRVGLDPHHRVGHFGQPPRHGADAAAHLENPATDERAEETEQMRAIAFGLAHRFQVVRRVSFVRLSLPPVGVAHAS